DGAGGVEDAVDGGGVDLDHGQRLSLRREHAEHEAGRRARNNSQGAHLRSPRPPKRGHSRARLGVRFTPIILLASSSRVGATPLRAACTVRVSLRELAGTSPVLSSSAGGAFPVALQSRRSPAPLPESAESARTSARR